MKYIYKKKIGVLGGSFDPPHNGHLKISIEAKKRFNLDKIYWVVTKKNPFKKKGQYNLNERISLSKKIVKKKSFIQVKYFEDKIKSNRTFKLIIFLKKKHPKYDIFFIMGADSLVNFHKWYKWKEISNNCKILVFDRFGYKEKLRKSISYKKLSKENLKVVNFKKVNISSSKLRKI